MRLQPTTRCLCIACVPVDMRESCQPSGYQMDLRTPASPLQLAGEDPMPRASNHQVGACLLNTGNRYSGPSCTMYAPRSTTLVGILHPRAGVSSVDFVDSQPPYLLTSRVILASPGVECRANVPSPPRCPFYPRPRSTRCSGKGGERSGEIENRGT